MGQPSKYTRKIADEICSRLAEGETLRQICRDPHVPSKTTVMRWLSGDSPAFRGFRDQYARARVLQQEHFADEILEISDDGSNDWMDRETRSGVMIEVPNHEVIHRSKLRVDTRKWLMERCAPKKYGPQVLKEPEAPPPPPERVNPVDRPAPENMEQWTERVKREIAERQRAALEEQK